MAILNKLNNLFILALCCVKFLITGKADKRKKNLDVFLVVSVGEIGDVICTTPVYKAIRDKYPKAKIIDFGKKIYKDILDYSGLVDEYLIRGKFWENVRKIKKRKVDFACLTGPDFQTLAELYLAGAPFISSLTVKGGYCPYETFPYRVLKKFVSTQTHYMGNYILKDRLNLLEPAGIFANDMKRRLGFSREAAEEIDKFFAKENIYPERDFIVGITPSAGFKTKTWKQENFAKVADYLFQKYNAKIIITGAKNDIDFIQKVFDSLDKNTKITDTVGIFNLDEFKALVSKFDLFISADTAPLYMAEAFDVPTVVIIGSVDENEQIPLGKIHKKVLFPGRGAPELHVMNARVHNVKKVREHFDGITPEMAIEKIEELVNDTRIIKL